MFTKYLIRVVRKAMWPYHADLIGRLTAMAGAVSDLDAAISTLTAQITGIGTDVQAALARVNQHEQELQQTIDALKASPAAPDLSNEISQLQAMANNIAGVRTTLQSIDQATAAAASAGSTPAAVADPAPAAPQAPAETVAPATSGDTAVSASGGTPDASASTAGNNSGSH